MVLARRKLLFGLPEPECKSQNIHNEAVCYLSYIYPRNSTLLAAHSKMETSRKIIINFYSKIFKDVFIQLSLVQEILRMRK